MIEAVGFGGPEISRVATPVLTYGFKGSANAVFNVFVASEPKKPQEQKCSIYNFIEKFIIKQVTTFYE